MPISWPSSANLPQRLLQRGYSESFPNNTIMANPDVGPPTIRRRSTAAITPFTGQLLLTSTQVTALETFYTTTTSGGSVQFTWVHPRTNAAATLIFLAPPRIVGVDGSLYHVELTMGVLP